MAPERIKRERRDLPGHFEGTGTRWPFPNPNTVYRPSLTSTAVIKRKCTTYITGALLPALYGVQSESHTTIPNPSYALRSTPMLETEETDPFRSQSQWSPALSIKTAMLSLQALLSSPEPSDPQDAVVAKQYISDYEEFKTTAKAWTVKYASANAKDEKLDRLMEMGFKENQARAALGRAAGDEQQALELLLTGL